MAQYYQIQNLDQKQIYADVQIVQVAEDVGQLVLQDDQILLNDGQQVVYQTAAGAATSQPQYPQQATTTHYIIGDDISQQQQQQQQQQPTQHQVLMHQQQQQQHPTMEHHPQQHVVQQQSQAAQPQQQQPQHYQPDPQQMQQEHQLQHVQTQQQTPPQQHQQSQQQPQTQSIYYTTDQIMQPNTLVQHSPHTQQQQEIQQQQQHQQLHVQQQQQYQQQQQQQIVHQQHNLQTSTQQQQHPHQQLQLQQTSPQIVYRMQQQAQQPQQQQQAPQMQQPTQMLNNTHVIVQQLTGQQVLIQSPQHQEIIMRQPMPQQRIIYNTNRVLYTSQQQPQTQAILQQSPQHQQQQQHIQLQASPMHTQARLVQTRVATQPTQQQSPQQQQMQQGVVFHQIQSVQNPQIAKTLQQQQHQQMQQIQQQQPQLVSTTVNMRGGMRGKVPRSSLTSAPSLIARAPGIPTMRAAVRPQLTGVGQTLKTPRPRSTATVGGTPRSRGAARGGRGGTTLAASRATQLTTSAVVGNNMQVLQQSPQMLQGNPHQSKHITITSPGQVKQIYRTQIMDGIAQQQLQIVHTQQRPQGVARFRSPSIGTPPQTTQMQQSSPTTSGSSGNFELDLEDSIQAVVVKKEQQKAIGSAAPSPMGTTLTTFYAKDDDDSRLVRTQNGTCMTLAEYKKRNAAGNTAVNAGVGQMKSVMSMRAGGPSPTNPPAKIPLSGHAVHSVPVARVAPQRIGQQQQPQQQQQMETQPQTSSVHQTSHNNYEIQTQHVLQNRSGQAMAEKDRNSAKMLVILVSGEQRLITFTLPRESCTVQDLLEQVGVPFDSNTTIQCVENPGANIDFVVTVGFSVQESASELISRAEQSLQMSRQQESNMAAATAATSTTNTTVASAAAIAAASVTTAGAGTAYTALSSNAPAGLGTEDATKDTAASSNAAAATTSKVVEEVPRKVIQGFYAICQSCGFSGYDHAKCERCKRVFLEPPKRVPCVKTSGGNTPNNETLTLVEKKRTMDMIARGSKVGLAYGANSTASRGRGASTARGRSGGRSSRRAAEAEPVILTLSSDEEDDDETSNNCSANMYTANSSNVSSTPIMPYKPLMFEPLMPEKDEASIYAEFIRGDVTDLSNCPDKLNTALQCKVIRIGTFRFEPQEPVIFTSRGIRILAPLVTNPNETFTLHIDKREVVKIIAHFSKTAESMLCFYMLRRCAQYIQTSLNMKDSGIAADGALYFSSNGPYHMRKIILQLDSITDQSKSVIKSIWDFFDEISITDAQDLLRRAADSDRQLAAKSNEASSTVTTTTTTQLNPNDIRQLLIYPPGKGGISINTEDYMCLATDQYLNDIIIDFYLKWVHNHIVPEQQRDRTFIFSTFFYKRLTTLTRHQHQDKEVKQTAAQKRHARVQNWTKNVNIFEKDFIIIPINEQSHWFLAIVCFPNLTGPVTFDTNEPVAPQQIKKQKGKKVPSQIGSTTITPLSKRASNTLAEVCGVGDDDESERDEAEGDESDLASEDSDFDNNTTTISNSISANATANATAASTTVASVAATIAAAGQPQAIKQPLVLIFDSLAGASRSRVVATLRDYLTCEYKVKMSEAPTPHVFNKDNMPGHCVKVPQQNNFTDCGLFLLQYVEQFFKDPIRDYRLPIKQLNNWFDTLIVTRKREDISILLQNLMNEKNGPNQRVILPEIPFPTLNGQLVEPPEGYNIEFEEDEMEEEALEEDEDYIPAAGTTGDTEMSGSGDDINGKAAVTAVKTMATTTSALVPTQGRKIVVKRRLLVSANVNSESATSSPTTTTTTTATAQTTNTRAGNMLKIRKVEQ